MRYVISFFIIIFFSFYFFITVFINFPEESIVVGEKYKEYKFLQNVLYQRWTFFAPPPESNKRAYFEFITKNDNGTVSVAEIELFEKFSKKLQSQYLLNDIAANSDYILFNYLESLINQTKDSYKYYKYTHPCENEECYPEFYEKYNKQIRTSIQIQFLINHAITLAKKSRIPLDSEFRIKVYEQDIPKYSERYNTNFKPVKMKVFSTDLVNLKTKKWKEYKDL